VILTGLWLFLVLHFQFHDADRGVSVPFSFCRPWTCLDRSFRAEVDTPAAYFAPVFPDGLALPEIDIASWADLYTGTAGGTGTCHGKLLGFIRSMGSKPGICHEMEKLTEDGQRDVPVFTVFDYGNDLLDLEVSCCKEISLFFSCR